jgi:hypothetical protein
MNIGLSFQERTCGDYSKHSIGGDIISDPLPYCNYTLSSGQGVFGNEDTSLVERNVVEMQINSTLYDMERPRSTIASMVIIRAQWNDSIPEHVNATECALSICVRKYKGSVQKSIFKEDIIDTFVDTTQSSATTGDDGMPRNFTMKVPQSWNNEKDGKNSDIFTVTWEAVTGLTQVFQGQTLPIFEGKYLSTGLGDHDIANLLRPLDDTGVKNLMERYVCQGLVSLHHTINMNHARIAASMTVKMRQNSLGDSSAITASSTGVTFQHLP